MENLIRVLLPRLELLSRAIPYAEQRKLIFDKRVWLISARPGHRGAV